jgi:hypothetical protein
MFTAKSTYHNKDVLENVLKKELLAGYGKKAKRLLT